jgi:hypothetical protein
VKVPVPSPCRFQYAVTRSWSEHSCYLGTPVLRN